jgi:hypothetical protein
VLGGERGTLGDRTGRIGEQHRLPLRVQRVADVLAVPIRSAAGALVAAVAMSARAEQDQLLAREIPVLAECADRLSPLLA